MLRVHDSSDIVEIRPHPCPAPPPLAFTVETLAAQALVSFCTARARELAVSTRIGLWVCVAHLLACVLHVEEPIDAGTSIPRAHFPKNKANISPISTPTQRSTGVHPQRPTCSDTSRSPQGPANSPISTCSLEPEIDLEVETARGLCRKSRRRGRFWRRREVLRPTS